MSLSALKRALGPLTDNAKMDRDIGRKWTEAAGDSKNGPEDFLLDLADLGHELTVSNIALSKATELPIQLAKELEQTKRDLKKAIKALPTAVKANITTDTDIRTRAAALVDYYEKELSAELVASLRQNIASLDSNGPELLPAAAEAKLVTAKDTRSPYWTTVRNLFIGGGLFIGGAQADACVQTNYDTSLTKAVSTWVGENINSVDSQ